MNARMLVYGVLAGIALVGIYTLEKSKVSSDKPSASPVQVERTTPQLAMAAAPTTAAPLPDQARMPDAKSNVFDIIVKRGKRVSGPGVIKLQQGDEVTLHITSDTADELHVHGYNLHVQLLPESTATLQFTAKLTGRFTYELHKSDLELGALEVFPR